MSDVKKFWKVWAVAFGLALLLVLVPGKAFAEFGDHTGDDDDYDDPSTVTVVQKDDGNFVTNFLDNINPFNDATVEDGYYRIQSAADNSFVIDAQGAGFARGTNIQLYENNNSDAQLWKIINQDDGYILIVNANSGLVLDVTGGVVANGTNIQSYFTNHTAAQLWKPVKYGSGFILVNKLNNSFVLDLSGGVIQNSQNIQLYERNNSAAQTWVFSACDAPELEIPALQLSLNGTTLDTINGGSKDTKYENNTLVVEESDKTTTCTEVEIKGRGNSTWVPSKKPYNIKLGSKTDLFGLGKAKKWALMANYYDPSCVRNDTAFYTAQLMSTENTWGGKFVNLYIDNEYVGLYWLTHRVEIGSNTVDLGEEGIICEMDGYTPDDIYFRSAIAKAQITLKDTSVDDTQAQTALDAFESTYNNFEKALYAKDWTGIQQYADVDTFAFMILLTDFVYNGDAFGNSQFFYKDSYSSKICCGPPWDYDASFFRYQFAINDPYMSIVFHNGDKRVDGLMMEVPEFRELVEQKYNEVLKPNATNIINYMKTTASSISKSAQKNNLKWHFSNVVNGIDYSNFKDDQNYVISCTQKHLQFLDMLYGSSVDVAEGYYNFTDKSGANLSKIKVQKCTDGYYNLIETNTGKAIGVNNAAIENNASCSYSSLTSHDMYRWKFSKVGNYYYIVSKRTGLVLDTYQGLHQYDMLGSNTQLYTMTSTTLDTIDIADGTVYDITSGLGSDIDMSASNKNVQTGNGQSINSSTFKFIKNDDGTYTLQDVASGLVVDVAANGSANGTNIQLYESNGSNAQKWILRKNSDGSCTFINPSSWKTLDISGGSTAIGTNIQLYEINNSAAQKWYFKDSVKQPVLDLASANKGTISAGVYTIASSSNNNFVLDVVGGSKDDGANVQLYQSNNTVAQKWSVTEDSQGFLTITNVGSGKVLDVGAALTTNRTNVQQYSSNNTYAQKWIAVKSNTTIKLVSALNSNKVLDLSGGTVANSSNIQLYDSNNTSAQRWLFTKVS